MADGSLVLCDCLCFIVSKYGKTSAKTLKTVLLDFYTAEELSTAKFQLCNDIDKLTLTSKRPHIAQRRDTDVQARINKEVDDIFLLSTFVDENKLLDKLPRYVAVSPDRMPSLRLYDGDMNVLLQLLHSMGNKLSVLESGLAAISRDVYSSRLAGGPSDWSSDWPQLPARSAGESTAAVCDINKSSKTRLCATVNRPSAVTSGPTHGNYIPPAQRDVISETETTQATSSSSTVPDWAILSSTPLINDNRYAVLQSTDDEECHDNHGEEPFEVVRSHQRKRTRQHTTPQQQNQQQQQSSAAQRRPPRAAMLLGKKSGSGGGNLKAAKTIRKKAVYCVDNVDTSCSVEDIRLFVSGLRIEVYSCFEVKSRRRRNEENVGERKAFRLCIPDDDRDKLLNAADWPDSVTVSEWYFKQAYEESDKRRRVDANDADETSVSGKPSSASSCSAAAAVNASADDSATAMDVPSDETLLTSNDDTILAACSFNDGR